MPRASAACSCIAGEADCAIGAPINPVRNFRSLTAAIVPQYQMKSSFSRINVSRNIPPLPDNTITHLFHKHNLMLFSRFALFYARGGFRRAFPARLDRAHFRAQALDEMLDMQRQRRAALHRDVGVELCRLDT